MSTPTMRPPRVTGLAASSTSAHPGGQVDRDRENRCQGRSPVTSAGRRGLRDPFDGAVLDEPDEHYDRAEAHQANADDAGGGSGDHIGSVRGAGLVLQPHLL